MAKYGAIQDEDNNNAAVFRGSNNEINGHERLISSWLRVTVVAAAVLLVFYFPRSDGSLLAASHLDVLGNPSKEDDDNPNEALFYDDQLVNHFTNDPIESK
eukprot:scaffold34931_cov38-Cyclotella_meneghiniana.AAC.1